jgi:hypothetical protein
MHELRSIMANGGRATLLAKRDRHEKRAEEGPSLTGLAIPRRETRTCNQRREDRHLNVVEKAELLVRRRKYEVAVINVSRHGAMIETDLELRIGERMEIRFGDCNPTECTVRWIRGNRIGVEFSRETVVLATGAVKNLIVGGRRFGEAPSEPEKPVRAPRQSLLWKAVLHWDHGTAQVRMRNISTDGAMLECRQEIVVDTSVVLDLGEGGIAPGIVRWSRGGQIGVQFEERFDLRNLVKAQHPTEACPSVVKPLYLESELDPNSPWAAAWDKFNPEDLDEPEDDSL